MAYYSFDDSTSTDKSGNGNTGTQVGGVTYVSGKFGAAANFDGVDDSISINVSHPYAFTKALWIKPTNLVQCSSLTCELI